jgi:NAD(P)-dependent dehydrogenase (short-subunit alcohol dehydrogenase family)
MTQKPLLQNKVAIVTGAGSRIGRAAAMAYAREGAAVVLSDPNARCGDLTLCLIEQAFPTASAMFVKADLTRPEGHRALVAATLDRFGKLDVACNNPGTAVDRSGVAAFDAMRAQIPAMLAGGGGSIVHVGASGDVCSMFDIAAFDYASRGIRINAMGPAPDAGRPSAHPIGRLARAEDVAELVLWLSSDRARFVAGSYYNIDGALVAS